MSNQQSEQVIEASPSTQREKMHGNRIWIAVLVLLILAAASITTYFVWNAWHQAEMQRALLAQQQLEYSIEQKRLYDEARAEVVTDTFYKGIFVDGHALAGLTREQARALIAEDLGQKFANLSYTIRFEDQEWELDAMDLGISYSIDPVLDEAWKIGRISGAADERSQIFERQQMIRALADNPVELSIPFDYDETFLNRYLNEIAENLRREPEATRATGFDIASKTFILAEARNGLEIIADGTVAQIKQDLAKRIFSGLYRLDSREIPPPASDLVSQVGNLKLISQATTYAKAVDVSRDTNISLVAKALNGYVIQPGEEFSFNQAVGKRTTEKGYREAGSILDGVLVKSVGGGICQPNTTLYQAVLKADLEVTARRPHQFPSTYTEVGLDATVSWGGSDMRFVNNTPYPVAIVCWYNKPEITFQLYGRQLPDGMTISLSAETIENKAPGAPIERLNPDLAPGSRVQVRSPHNLKRARSYKIWKKDGAIVRTELAATSYYPPIPAIFEYGPPLPPETQPVVPPVTEAPTEPTAPAETSAPTETVQAPA